VTDFKVGDTVKVNGSKTTNATKWEGLEYIVTDVEPSDNGDYQMVTGKVTCLNHFAAWTTPGSTVRFKSTQLYPKPFTFADIKVGDKVRRTQTWADTGTVKITEGVVDTLTCSNAITKEWIEVGHSDDDKRPSDVTLELLERPEPHFTETAEVGTRYRVRSTFNDKVWFILTKRDNGSWERLTPHSGAVDFFDPKYAKEYFDEREHALVK
jgi:hypothetical protein